MPKDHVCHVDCELIPGTIHNGNRDQHIMYPVDTVSWTRSTYHNGRNQTRREYRATGLDESRNVRDWNYNRKISQKTAPNFRRDYQNSQFPNW